MATRGRELSSRKWKPLAVDYEVYDPVMVGSIDGTDCSPHDRAIERACNTTYRPNKQIQSVPRRTIFVGNLSTETVEGDVYDAFKKYGDILYLRLVQDIVTGYSRRYAFVEYASTDSAKNAIEHGCDMFINKMKIIIEMEHERTLSGWKPRRFGGGFGGKKQAGQLRFGGIERPFKEPIL